MKSDQPTSKWLVKSVKRRNRKEKREEDERGKQKTRQRETREQKKQTLRTEQRAEDEEKHKDDSRQGCATCANDKRQRNIESELIAAVIIELLCIAAREERIQR